MEYGIMEDLQERIDVYCSESHYSYFAFLFDFVEILRDCFINIAKCSPFNTNDKGDIPPNNQ